jgi:alpha-glucosidase
MQLLGNNPVGWDSTIVLDAKIGNYVITARKKSTTWYIGGITNWQERTIKLPLNFLPPGNYRTTICLDGINANRNANDYLIKQVTLNTHLPLEIHMAKGGGYYAKLELIPE